MSSSSVFARLRIKLNDKTVHPFLFVDKNVNADALEIDHRCPNGK